MAKASTAKKPDAAPTTDASQSRVVPTIMLTKHVDETFKSQMICLSGHGYVNCKFENCTLVVTNMPHLVNGCQFTNCNWRLEYNILWGEPATRANIRQLLDLVDGVAAAETPKEAVAN